jgi:hypothetical protein
MKLVQWHAFMKMVIYLSDAWKQRHFFQGNPDDFDLNLHRHKNLKSLIRSLLHQLSNCQLFKEAVHYLAEFLSILL